MRKRYITNFACLSSTLNAFVFAKSALLSEEHNRRLVHQLLTSPIKSNALFLCLRADYNNLAGECALYPLKQTGNNVKLCPFATIEEALSFLNAKFPFWRTFVFSNEEAEAKRIKGFLRRKRWNKVIKVIGFDSSPYWYDFSSVQEEEPIDRHCPNPYPYYGGNKVALPTSKPTNARIPVLNECVKTGKGNTLKLKRLLGAGNEGSIYECDDSTKVIKILKEGRINDRVKEKIEFMAKNPIDDPHVCWPLDSVRNSGGEFVGFLMQRIEGMTLSEFVMQNESDKEGFGVFNVTKTGLVKIIISILNTLCGLHKKNILVGDIKLENFILEIKNGYINYNNVFLLDADSFQIDKFPATMVTEGYIAPEQRDCGMFYHTFGEENYSLFVLLFRLLFKDKKPYDQIQTTTDYTDREKAKMGRFPYSLNKALTEKGCPPGYPPLCWSHLPGYVKQAFIAVGSHSGANNAPDKRLSSFQWLEIFQRYKTHLSNGTLRKRDPDYNKGMFSYLERDAPIEYGAVDINFDEDI